MRTLSASIRAFLLGSFLCGATAAWAEPPRPDGDPQYWSHYNAGLMAMREGRLQDAVPLFTAAIQRTSDPHAFLARAVANTLLQNFDNALADLTHAQLPAPPGEGPPSREPELWGYCIWAMADKPPASAGPRAWFAGIPGNMVQGGNDYPTDYASNLVYEMATPYRKAREAKADLNAPALQAARKKAGQWFANRTLATGPMASFNLDYARDSLDKNQLASALDAANLAKMVYPFDADVRLVSAEIDRRLGRVETARREYTVALTIATNSAVAYRGRALAAAAEGDVDRVRSDLRWALKYDPKSPPDVAQAAEALLANNAVNASPQSLLARLDADAAAGKSVEKLLPLALDLQKASASTRLRYDEIYQENLRQLEDATREKPGNPAGFVALAAYLLDELDNRGETVEPRRGMQFYRYQYSQAMEVSRAMFALQQALKIDPNNPAALVRVAFAYDAIDQTDNAQTCINQVMQQVGTQNADAVRLLAEYRAGQAANLQSHARQLRTPRYVSASRIENRSDGVYQVTSTFRIDPSSDQLQQATDLDQRAHEVLMQAKTLMESAIKENPDSLEGLLLQAAYQNGFGTEAKALQVLQQTVEKFPTALKAHDALLDFEIGHGMDDQALEERLAESRLFQTTAGPLLERIWQKIQGNGWPALQADLQRAREIDPADARTTEYLAPAQWDDKKNAASMASKREAVALELARLQLDDQADGVKLSRPATDFAIIMQMYTRAAVQESNANQLDAALADARAAAGFRARYAAGGYGALMFEAMLPDPKAPATPVAAPVNGATLAAQALVTEAQALKTQNKINEAVACFQAVINLGRPYNSGIPEISNGDGDSNYTEFAAGRAVITACVELAKLDIAAQDYPDAMNALEQAGANKPDRQTALEINTLITQVVPHLGAAPRPAPPPAAPR